MAFFSFSNRKFTELYTEDLNGNRGVEYWRKGAILESIALGPLEEMLKGEEWQVKCLSTFHRIAKSGRAVLNVLKEVALYNHHPNDFDADFDEMTGEIDALYRLKRRFKNYGQTFVFGSDREDDEWHILFAKRITLPGEFKFLKDTGPVDSEWKGRLSIEWLLPFKNAKHQDADCVAAKDLPLFYKNKGKV